MFTQRPLDGPFKCRIFIKNNNLSALTDSAHNKPSSLYCSPKMFFRSRAKSRVIGCSKAFACVVLRYWTDTHGAHWEKEGPPPPPPPPRSPHRANASEREETRCWMCFVFLWQLPFTSHKRRSKRAASYLIFVWFGHGFAAPQLCRRDSISKRYLC